MMVIRQKVKIKPIMNREELSANCVREFVYYGTEYQLISSIRSRSALRLFRQEMRMNVSAQPDEESD